ncbi:ATP synthase subunit d, mitochondrial [Tribolium castaneum]|uniref:ATP synthase subunit d, mitochondrial n=1 Tax=Tribolium castaneum TaxID=7070 RepID=D6WH57_TRICA|nr:PREDICTED: ATP synthase subunit d, mitochondrial [Tribolium castaneum]EFA01349.1 ATP synthase subunit d, mitochondrial-like Protein [Tribolium castaneum]|eukprot:XP_968885.1 PREDICTED: ATP synthase subunit d, mitochondrial [Tribolium castaneum]
MAAKRIAQSSINWAQLAERVPPHQKGLFQQFKSKSDHYLRRVMENPEKAPEINWSFYKSRVPVAGMVDEFQKQYSALKIPYPPDTVSSQVDAQEQEIKGEIEKFKRESSARISQYEKQLAHLTSLIPFDKMTMEDFRDAYPEQALDPINRPTFWPHGPEDQPGPHDEASGHH